MNRPPGTPVKLTAVSWDGPSPEQGDFLRTSTGRTYWISDVRPGRSGGHYRLSCVVCGPGVTAWPEPGDTIHEWRWLSRSMIRPGYGSGG